VLALGMPATFPPESVNGLVVAGSDAPVAAGDEARSASEPGLYRAVAERAGSWTQPDLAGNAHEEGWHERALDQLLEDIHRKKRFALEALAQSRAAAGGPRPDLLAVVFSESDTVAHHFWRDWDPLSPHCDPEASQERKGAMAAVYEHLDAACGEIRAAFGRDALCTVISDHGSHGASRRVVHLNRRLAECGLLRRSGARSLAALARWASDRGLSGPEAAQRASRRARRVAARVESAARFGGIEWRGTAAFSEEVNTQPGVWINLRGREAEGSVDPADYERVRAEVIDLLLDWELPDGQPVVERARPREEVYAGPCVDRAPDVVVELALDAGYGLTVAPVPWSQPEVGSVRQLGDDEFAGGRGMSGVHGPEGVWIATGPPTEWLDGKPAASLQDVTPTLLCAMGLPVGASMDGAALNPARATFGPDGEASLGQPF
jgi:predicted AlkP superfamily phosphohydrolase/phosphomutase